MKEIVESFGWNVEIEDVNILLGQNQTLTVRCIAAKRRIKNDNKEYQIYEILGLPVYPENYVPLTETGLIACRSYLERCGYFVGVFSGKHFYTLECNDGVLHQHGILAVQSHWIN